jgi:hypothetical protein
LEELFNFFDAGGHGVRFSNKPSKFVAQATCGFKGRKRLYLMFFYNKICRLRLSKVRRQTSYGS